jgi:peptide/nickel transport system ATP-binding protein
MRISRPCRKIAEGSVFGGLDLVKARRRASCADIRGREISMIFQSPRTALNPIRKVGDQIEDVLLEHVKPLRRADLKAREIARAARGRDRRPRASATAPIRSSCPAACASA